MCGRYFIRDHDQEILDIINKIKDKEGMKLSGEIYPGDIVPVISNNKDLNPTGFKMKWGYHIGNTTIINAKSETIYDKKMFIDGIKNRRCVIPASNYFEWETIKKTKYLIKAKDRDVIYLAGIYRFEDNKPVFSIITRYRDENISHIHDRMPLIINRNDIERWLNKDSDISDILNTIDSNLEYEEVVEAEL